MKEQQQVPIHTEYIQIDQLLKLEGIIETGGQIKSFIDEGILTLNGQVVTEKRKKCRVGDVISCEGLDVDLIITQEDVYKRQEWFIPFTVGNNVFIPLKGSMNDFTFKSIHRF